MKHLLLILGLLAVLASCNEQTVRKQGFGVHGIDVSHYQQHIDWATVAAQDIRFAFAKATEGISHQDTLFCQNWEKMKTAGLKRGAYHFFRPTIDPLAQAKNFIDLADLGHGDLPPVLDVEVMDGVDAEALRNNMSIWLQVVENHYKVKPIIYTNQKFFNQHLSKHFRGYPVWIARYNKWRKPALEAGHEWDFWQYGNQGRIAGIHGNVDFNVFRGSEAELEKLCLIRPAPLFDPPPLVEEVVAAAP